jgi:hypothetical protein
MSDKSQPQPVPQDDDNKNVQDVQPKYTVKLYGKYVPIWVIVLVVAVLAWVAWHMWTEHQKKAFRLTSSARVDLDKAGASPVSPGSASAGIPLSTPSTDETRKQLNKLFNSF